MVDFTAVPTKVGFFAPERFDYKGRYVRTKRYAADEAANRQLYGYYRNPFTDDPSIRDPSRPNLRTVSNTAPVIHAGKLFTLKEDGLPHQIDPVTLETLGTWDFNGAWKSQTFTAHPKLDPTTGEMVAFGYEATGLATNDVFIYKSKSDTWTEEILFPLPIVDLGKVDQVHGIWAAAQELS